MTDNSSPKVGIEIDVEGDGNVICFDPLTGETTVDCED